MLFWNVKKKKSYFHISENFSKSSGWCFDSALLFTFNRFCLDSKALYASRISQQSLHGKLIISLRRRVTRECLHVFGKWNILKMCRRSPRNAPLFDYPNGHQLIQLIRSLAAFLTPGGWGSGCKTGWCITAPASVLLITDQITLDCVPVFSHFPASFFFPRSLCFLTFFTSCLFFSVFVLFFLCLFSSLYAFPSYSFLYLSTFCVKFLPFFSWFPYSCFY